MTPLYPIALRIEGRRCLVIGGGRVAERKVAGLLAAGALVTVIAPDPSHRIQEHVSQRRVQRIAREYQEGDLAGAFLVIAATNDAGRNRSICEAAEERGLLHCNVNDPENGTFFVPAVIRRGELLVSVSTSGHSPAATRWMREKLEAVITPTHGELVALLGRLRDEILRQLPDPEKRSRVLREVLDSRVMPLLEAGDAPAAEEAIRSCISSLSD